MNKRDFLKTTGLLGVASMLPFGKTLAKANSINANGTFRDCKMMTAG